MFDKKFEELRMTGNLPSPSGVGLGILQLTQDEDFTLSELAQAISGDPALSGRILKLANSAMGAGVEPVTDVHSASMKLGVRSVRSVALGFCLISENRSGVCDEFDYTRYWSLSLSSAVIAQSLAAHLKMNSAAEAFTCALLSRVGMLALASVHPGRYAKTLRSTRGGSLIALLEAETSAFDITHSEVTAALLRDWKLPEAFGEVATRLGQSGRPLDSLPAHTRELLSIVNASWMLAPMLLGSSGSHDEEFIDDTRLSGVAVVNELDSKVMRAALVDSLAAWGEWKSMLELQDSKRRTARDGGKRVLEDDQKPDISKLIEEVEEPISVDPLVMIVDDDERIIRLLKHVLEKDGFRLIVARNGAEALELASEHQPQIIITDWRMPQMSGVELCQKLKRSESLRNSYVIMLSAQEKIEDIEGGFAAGADDYVCKPFSTSVLLARVRAGRRVLELHAQLEQERNTRTKQVSELGAMTRRLRSVTMTDMLTELPNRRYALRRVAEEWHASTSRQEPMALVMIDVDYFKQVNDSYGHEVGDHVLRETARVLKENTRLGDVVCRFGGEEFLVINIDCDRETAVNCSERLRLAVEANHIQYGDFDGHVTISLGVAERTAQTGTVDELLKEADRAVYRAKRSGRNQIDGGDSGPNLRLA